MPQRGSFFSLRFRHIVPHNLRRRSRAGKTPNFSATRKALSRRAKYPRRKRIPQAEEPTESAFGPAIPD